MVEYEFYVIANALFDDKDYAYAEKIGDVNLGDAIKCPECGTFLTMLKWLPPHEVRLSKKTVGDFIFGTHTGFIVSKRFKESYETLRLEGLSKFMKVDIHFRGQLLNDQYYYPEIALSNVKVDLIKSGLKLVGEKKCSTCQKAGRILNGFDAVYFLEPEKIKEDIFFTMALGQATIVVSERFKKFAESNSFTNLKLVEASKYRWDAYKVINYEE